MGVTGTAHPVGANGAATSRTSRQYAEFPDIALPLSLSARSLTGGAVADGLIPPPVHWRAPCLQEVEMGRHDDAEKKAEGNGSGTYDPDKVEDPSKDGGRHDEDKRD